MDEDEILQEDLRFHEDLATPRRVIDERMFKEPIRVIEHRPPISVQRTTPVAGAIQLMKQSRTGCLLVEEGGKLVGIFTERDILMKLLGTGQDLAAIPVQAVMTANPEALTDEDEIAWAIHLMSVGGFRHLPLVDSERRPIGVLSVRDVVDYIVGFFPSEVLNLPPEPGQHARIPEGG